MKSLIKSSFLLILLVAIFNIGLNNAYAEEIEGSKIITKANKIETVDITSSISFQEDFQQLSNSVLLDCENSVTNLPGGTVITTVSCDIIFIDNDGNVFFLTNKQ